MNKRLISQIQKIHRDTEVAHVRARGRAMSGPYGNSYALGAALGHRLAANLLSEFLGEFDPKYLSELVEALYELSRRLGESRLEPCRASSIGHIFVNCDAHTEPNK